MAQEKVTVDGYVPGIATKCWVGADKIQEGDQMWLTIGAQRMGLAAAGPADSAGWRPVWWFANGAKLPLCMCTHMQVAVCPCAPDGTDDHKNRVPAKWEFEPPTDAMETVITKAQMSERFVIPVKYPCSDKEYIITFAAGTACPQGSGAGWPDDPAFYAQSAS